MLSLEQRPFAGMLVRPDPVYTIRRGPAADLLFLLPCVSDQLDEEDELLSASNEADSLSEEEDLDEPSAFVDDDEDLAALAAASVSLEEEELDLPLAVDLAAAAAAELVGLAAAEELDEELVGGFATELDEDLDLDLSPVEDFAAELALASDEPVLELAEALLP